MALSERSIAVRMYNVGFGDCFLLRFPGPDHVRTMLVDCGQHSASEKPFDLEDDVVTALLDDVTGQDGTPRIDVVVMTHRHQDHVKGFEDPRWDDVEVGEVWLPWTENPNDPEARSLLERQSGAALRLSSLVEAEADPMRLVAMNSLTNEAAMGTLHAGFSGEPSRRFFPELSEGVVEATLAPDFPIVQTDLLPGVTVRLLGPTRDEAVIRRMNPPDTERFVSAARGDLVPTGRPLPFGPWRIAQDEFNAAPEYQHLDLRNRGKIVAAGREDAYLLSVAVEQTVNNTSLMLLIQLGRASLLFPGDSQWGTWDRVLQSDEGRELLSRTTFYKVGHHGSHNATPRTLVEALLHDVQGMVSVAPTGIPSWGNIPKMELLDALTEPGRCLALAISHEPGQAPKTASVEKDGLVCEMQVPV